ncbi:MAG: signal peptidase II [Fusobacteriota bacterium]
MVYYLITLVVVILDQISKYLIVKKFSVGETIPIIEDFFHLTYVENKGVAFGFFYGHVTIFAFIAVISIIGIILYIHKQDEEHSLYSKIGFMFILGGAIGNLGDRIIRGYVVDFIDFRGIWPYIFNIADVAINIGVILILIEYFIEVEIWKKKESIEEEQKI